MFSSITSLKMIVAPALLSALAISKPIPYDATSNRPSIALSGNGIPEQISGLNTLFG